MRVLLAVTSGFALGAVFVVACHANPSIDGSKVAPIGSAASPAKCDALCNRLAALCGYAPTGCVDDCVNWDLGHRVCTGQSPNCQDALQSCVNAEAGDEAGGDAGDEASADDGSADAATE